MHAFNFDNSNIIEQEVARKNSLQGLTKILIEAQKIELDRESFGKIFAHAIKVLELSHNEVAREFKISRPTVSRWEAGISAPHPLGRKPVFQLFEKLAKAKLRQHEV